MRFYGLALLLLASSRYNRHEELAQELRRRRYRHNSELDVKWKRAKKAGLIDKKRHLEQLIDRCAKCRERHQSFFGSEL